VAVTPQGPGSAAAQQERALRTLDGAAAALREDASLVPSDGLRRRVMATVRAEARRGDALTVARDGLGRVQVARAAAAAALRHAADAVPGVRARSCRVEPDPDGVPGAGGVRPVRVTLTVVVAAGAVVPAVADAVRARVARAAAVLGLTPAAVDVVVEDLFGV
jgi:hypothetical protein